MRVGLINVVNKQRFVILNIVFQWVRFLMMPFDGFVLFLDIQDIDPEI